MNKTILAAQAAGEGSNKRPVTVKPELIGQVGSVEQ